MLFVKFTHLKLESAECKTVDFKLTVEPAAYECAPAVFAVAALDKLVLEVAHVVVVHLVGKTLLAVTAKKLLTAAEKESHVHCAGRLFHFVCKL